MSTGGVATHRMWPRLKRVSLTGCVLRIFCLSTRTSSGSSMGTGRRKLERFKSARGDLTWRSWDRWIRSWDRWIRSSRTFGCIPIVAATGTTTTTTRDRWVTRELAGTLRNANLVKMRRAWHPRLFSRGQSLESCIFLERWRATDRQTLVCLLPARPVQRSTCGTYRAGPAGCKQSCSPRSLTFHVQLTVRFVHLHVSSTRRVFDCLMFS